MKPKQLEALLVRAIPEKSPLLITGAPGIGKTMIVKQVCNQLECKYIVMHPVISDPTDFKGIPWISREGKEAVFLPFGELNQILEAKALTACVFEDIGQAAPATQASVMQIIHKDSRELNGRKISPHVCFLACTNRKADKAGVSGMLEPVKSRFWTIVNLETDLDDWCSWALNKGINTELIAFLRFRPALLHDFKPTADLTNSPSPRTAENIDKWLKMHLSPGLEFEVFSGCAGEGFASEFMGFLKIYRSLPDPDKVLLQPMKAKVPTDPATLYALCGALSQRASEQNMDRVVQYANRLPSEFSVLLVYDAWRMHPEIAGTRAFISWHTEHKDVLI